MGKVSHGTIGVLLLLAACNGDDAARNVLDSGILTRDASADANVGDPKGDGGVDASPPANDSAIARGAHCAPGTYVKTWTEYASGCFGEKFRAAGKAGLFAQMPKYSPLIDDIGLATPITPGEPYAASFEISYRGVEGEFQLEVWGTTAECGAGTTADMLFVAPVDLGEQIICADLKAAKPYTRLLLVIRNIDDVRAGDSTIERLGATFCSAGSCL